MTTERKKAILTLTLTLVLGVLLGILLPSLFHKIRDQKHDGHGRMDRDNEHKKEWFAGTIYHIVQPDSTQSKNIKPVLEWASHQIDSLETASNNRLAEVLDSVRIRLKPFIREDQLKRLNEFDTKAQKHWRRHDHHEK